MSLFHFKFVFGLYTNWYINCQVKSSQSIVFFSLETFYLFVCLYVCLLLFFFLFKAENHISNVSSINTFEVSMTAMTWLDTLKQAKCCWWWSLGNTITIFPILTFVSFCFGSFKPFFSLAWVYTTAQSQQNPGHHLSMILAWS